MESVEFDITTLDNGVRAVLINLPHFRTHSARMLVHSGSLHEQPGAYGSAHFLEHLTFQGTSQFPNIADMDAHTDNHGIYRNASTNKVETKYVADGFALPPVAECVGQLALQPLLREGDLEAERAPILDELRGYYSNPSHDANTQHDANTFGQDYARPIGGGLEEVAELDHDDLTEFYERNYRIGNITLVVCSADPVEEQKAVASEFTARSAVELDETEGIDLSKFNPNDVKVSPALVDLPETAETIVELRYDTSNPENNRGFLLNRLAGSAVSHFANRKLRNELSLCYGVKAGVRTMVEFHSFNRKSWSYFGIGSSTSSERIGRLLQGIKFDVLGQDIPSSSIETVTRSLLRSVDRSLEGRPADIADLALGHLPFAEDSKINFEQFRAKIASIRADDISERINEILNTKPLLCVTSPSVDAINRVQACLD